MTEDVLHDGPPYILPPPDPDQLQWTDPVQLALDILIEARRAEPATQADLADPVRRQWLKESAIGQDLKINKETLRILDILCWSREDPAVLLSVPELVSDLGRQLAQIATLAIYLAELAGVSLEQLSRSYAAACGINDETISE
jgi:hypothetical protein